ncbi:MAG: septal ring lytic transglycosylase RlpA family protein [Nitrospinota bacterium]
MNARLALAVTLVSLLLSGGCALAPVGSGTTGAGRSTKPYTVNGVTYVPRKSARGFRQVGIASWYGFSWALRRTASGERYNPYKMTAAHKTLPLTTPVRVTNLENGRSIVVRINDRGPFVRGRIIDLSYSAAEKLGFRKKGTARVRLEALPRS